MSARRVLPEVLHVNVRLSEGGAAGVARTLLAELPEHGFQAQIAYGYGPGGDGSPLEAETGATRITSRARAAANLLSHRYLGEEKVRPDPDARARLATALKRADVVHLHAIHSYMMPPRDLLDQIGSLGKPVVWTMHDQWLMTGRCAQPGTCGGWRTGCVPCPFPSAYPPAVIDRAAGVWEKRRAAVAELARRSPLALVACARWLGADLEDAGFEGARVVTNSVDGEFWRVLGESPERVPGFRLLFMCRDLRDPKKVDLPLLRDIARLFPGRLTIIGDNLPEDLPGAVVRPAITDRTQLVHAMRSHSHLVFTSQIDYYPLTVAEALCAGMEILAVTSKAAQEFADHPQMHQMDDHDAFLEAVRRASHDDGVIEPFGGKAHFSPARMASEYAAIYRELLA